MGCFSLQQTEPHTGHITIEVLQSQLLILKVLSITLASRWTRHSSNFSNDDRSSNSSSERLTPKVHSVSSTSLSWEEAPPLDDSCIKYILSVMVLFIRQTASSDVPLMVATRSTDTSFRDFDDRVNIQVDASATSVPPPPLPLQTSPQSRPSVGSFSSAKMAINCISHIAAANAKYENTHMSMVNSSIVINNLIARYVGRIIFHLSASNWKVVFERLSTKINYIATHPELTPDSIDLQFLSHCVMDRTRLVVLLNRVFSFFFLSIVA